MASKYKNNISYDKRDYTLPYSEISDEKETADDLDDYDGTHPIEDSTSEASSEIVYQLNKMRNSMSVCVFDMADILTEDIGKFISKVRG